MAYRTLAELEADIRFRFDLEGFTARHSQAQIFRLINDAYRTLRERLTSDGSTLFLSMSEVTGDVGKNVNYPGTLLQPTGALVFSTIHEIHVNVDSRWRKLQPISLADLLERTDGVTAGIPQYWCIAGTYEGDASGTETGQGLVILLAPVVDAIRSYRIVGLRHWDDLTTTTSRLLTDQDLHQYVIAQVGVWLADRDDDVALRDRRAVELERIYADTRSRMLRRAPAPRARVDVRGRRRFHR